MRMIDDRKTEDFVNKAWADYKKAQGKSAKKTVKKATPKKKKK